MNLDYGIGAYAAQEASRMVGMSQATLRRWLLGYRHDSKHEPVLWKPQYKPDEDGVLLGFRDLVEARIVNALRERRIGLTTIRKCIERARVIVGDERPFSTQQFRTDGKTIFLEITRDIDEPEFIDLRKSQGVFKRVVEPAYRTSISGHLAPSAGGCCMVRRPLSLTPHGPLASPFSPIMESRRRAWPKWSLPKVW